MSQRHSHGATEQLLSAAIEAGQLRPQPVRPLATVILGALDEAALYLADAEESEREQAEAHVRAVVRDLDGMLGGAG